MCEAGCCLKWESVDACKASCCLGRMVVCLQEQQEMLCLNGAKWPQEQDAASCSDLLSRNGNQSMEMDWCVVWQRPRRTVPLGKRKDSGCLGEADRGKKKAGQLREGQKQQTQKGMGAKAGRMNLSEANAILCGPGLTLSVWLTALVGAGEERRVWALGQVGEVGPVNRSQQFPILVLKKLLPNFTSIIVHCLGHTCHSASEAVFFLISRPCHLLNVHFYASITLKLVPHLCFPRIWHNTKGQTDEYSAEKLNFFLMFHNLNLKQTNLLPEIAMELQTVRLSVTSKRK